MITPGAGVGDTESPVDVAATVLLREISSRYEDLRYLYSYMDNHPLGNAYEADEEAQFNGIDQLRDMSRNNYAKTIVESLVDRLGVLGFKTAAYQDETGDDIAIKAFDDDGMGEKWGDALQLACGYRKSYLLVDPLTKKQKIIPPNNAAVIADTSGEPVAAITMQHDRALGLDRMTLFYRSVNEATGEADGPVKMFIATRDRDADLFKSYSDIKLTDWDTEVPLSRSMELNWAWWKQIPTSLERIPVTTLSNKFGKSEFEDATENIDRINHMIFQRVIITTMQSFRQRAVKGNFPNVDPVTGREIDYSEMFSASPSAMWLLPENGEIWESSPPGLADILEGTKADVRDLAVLSNTPIERFFPDEAASGEVGASLSREGYTSKVTDRRSRFGARLSRHMSVYFEVIGDKERSDQTLMEVIWEPIQSSSITEQSASFSSFRSAGMPLSVALRRALGMSPKEIRQVVTEKNMEDLTKQLSDSINQATPLQRASYGGAQQPATQARQGKSGNTTGYNDNAEQMQQAKENRPARQPGMDNKLKGK